ncbi:MULTISPECIES: hypothetical protein [Methylobacterium]|uniref:Uncharacterized protein n=1 Tax=Methylobacterium thuringiense TaxID=1003091 RepID=A0ABQ4TLI2_9HYPH|nr:MULTISPECIES: hypothetical protein [Methylobacterium]TXN21463.1 hypothetical protein FV217_14320 [Methylobacterium sp. WL9]GJE55159.1 hypothetical protein EKPJFOCH_1647 [Methylobacterium thuringiense]
MRPVAVVAVSVLTLAASIADAEARGFRLRGSSFSVPHRSASARDTATRRLPIIAAVGAIGPFDPSRSDARNVTRSARGSEADGADETAPIPPMPPAPVSLAVEKVSEPWCPSGRIAGTGTGFCLIN